MTSSTPKAQLVKLMMLQVLFCRAMMLSSTGSKAWHMDGPRGLISSASSASKSTCTDLKNQGTHFTVDIEVGTPGQKFSVVADTGSNSLIVPSCICRQRMFCSKDERCFTGTNKSSTFLVEKDPRSIQITFGSGIIEAVPAKDVVRVGHMDVTMVNGLLLMTGRRLRMSGRFEGILGLGLPNASAAMLEQAEAAEKSQRQMMNDIIDQILGGHGAANAKIVVGSPQDSTPKHFAIPANKPLSSFLGPAASPDLDSTEASSGLPDWLKKMFGGGGQESGSIEQVQTDKTDAVPDIADKKKDGAPSGFLEQAGSGAFSMCFNDGADGVLQIGESAHTDAEALGNLGKIHWGVELAGLSVGDKSAKVAICSKENMTKDQETACGAIPDSGTTVIMAPKDQLTMMFEGICDQWDRCVKNYTALEKAAHDAKEAATATYGFDPFDIAVASKADVLALLLLDCAAWLTEEKGLNELPPVHFDLKGSNGRTKTLELPGWAYVLESAVKDMNETHKHLTALLQEETLKNASKWDAAKKVCSPAFGVMDYHTALHGATWILGTPLFYEYHVGYNLVSSPPSISFVSTHEKPCTSCDGKASLLSQQGRQNSSHPQQRRPRWISGPYRLPDIDLSQPL